MVFIYLLNYNFERWIIQLATYKIDNEQERFFILFFWFTLILFFFNPILKNLYAMKCF